MNFLYLRLSIKGARMDIARRGVYPRLPYRLRVMHTRDTRRKVLLFVFHGDRHSCHISHFEPSDSVLYEAHNTILRAT